MGSINKVMLIGNLGRDAELRYTPGGAPVSTVNIATTETWTGKDGTKNEKTEWHRCVLWGKMAESLQEYLVKGKQIWVEGKLQTRQWEDKDGHKRYTTEVRADRVVLLGGSDRRRDGDHSSEEDPVAATGGGADEDFGGSDWQ
jgi:single-strand DNA-binding protein